MNTILAIITVLLVIAGIVGTFLPVLPGPPLSWGGLLVAYFAFTPHVSAGVLWTTLAVTIVAQVLDYVAPIWITKAGGGSKAATTGSTIGMIVGLFFMPWGLILGPMIGAWIGEMSNTNRVGSATRVAMLSFLSFLLTTGLKLVVCLVIAYYAAVALWQGLM